MSILLRFMTRLVFGLFLVVHALGCGNQSLSTADPGVEPPHEGTLFPLPAGKGFIEIVKKNGTSPISSEVSFYLYRDGSYTPYDSMPDSAVLLLDSNHSVKLKLVEDALVTPEGPVLFAKRDVEGLLRFELEGDSIQVVLGGR